MELDTETGEKEVLLWAQATENKMDKVQAIPEKVQNLRRFVRYACVVTDLIAPRKSTGAGPCATLQLASPTKSRSVLTLQHRTSRRLTRAGLSSLAMRDPEIIERAAGECWAFLSEGRSSPCFRSS